MATNLDLGAAALGTLLVAASTLLPWWYDACCYGGGRGASATFWDHSPEDDFGDFYVVEHPELFAFPVFGALALAGGGTLALRSSARRLAARRLLWGSVALLLLTIAAALSPFANWGILNGRLPALGQWAAILGAVFLTGAAARSRVERSRGNRPLGGPT